MNYLIAICFAGLVCAGCATTGEQAAQPPKRIVQSPADGLRELDIVARALPPIGNVLPIQLAVTNLTLKPLTLDPQGVQADRIAGASVAVLPVTDAEQAAGGADQLAKALTRENLVHVTNHQMSVPFASAAGVAKICASAAQSGGGGGPGAGGLFLLVCGGSAVVALGYRAAVAASPDLQVKDIALGYAELAPGVEAWGYIFLPRANYTGIEVPVKSDTGGTEIIAQPWDSAAGIAAFTQSEPSTEAPVLRNGQAASPATGGLSGGASAAPGAQSKESAR